jgi:hypothetical protein
MPGGERILGGAAYRSGTDDLRISRRIRVVLPVHRSIPFEVAGPVCSARVPNHRGLLLADSSAQLVALVGPSACKIRPDCRELSLTWAELSPIRWDRPLSGAVVG